MKSDQYFEPFADIEFGPPGMAIDRGQFDGIPPMTPADLERRILEKASSVIPARCTLTREVKPVPEKKGRKLRGIRCIETGIEYRNAVAAAAATGLNLGTITGSAYHKVKLMGFSWEFTGPAIFVGRKSPARQAVYCVETGKKFASMAEAAKSIGARPSGISQAIRLNGRAGGFHWARMSNTKTGVSK